MAVFGTTNATGTTNLDTLGKWRGCSGVTPADAGAIDSFEIFFNGGDVPIRIALYLDGGTNTLDGATLIHDQAYTVPTSSFGWVVIPIVGSASLPANARVHMVVIGDDALNVSIRPDATEPAFSASDFDSAYQVEIAPSTSEVAAPDPAPTVTETAYGFPYRYRINYTIPTKAGIPAGKVMLDGVAQLNLTGASYRVLAGAGLKGTEYFNTTTGTTDGTGTRPALDCSASVGVIGDAVTLQILTADGKGTNVTTTLQDIA